MQEITARQVSTLANRVITNEALSSIWDLRYYATFKVKKLSPSTKFPFL